MLATDLETQVWVTALATLLSFVAGYFLALLVESKKRQDDRVDAANALVTELETNRNSLQRHVRTDEQVDRMQGEFRAGRINTEVFTLQTGAYRSTLNSGILQKFPLEIQVNMADTYANVELANEMEMQFLRIFTQTPTTVTAAFADSIGMFFLSMNGQERDTLNRIINLIALLRGRYRITSQT